MEILNCFFLFCSFIARIEWDKRCEGNLKIGKYT